eukprot:Skav205996  [mRNA]  locus=scaffold2084:230469:234611:- [translate_table: standard]
MDLLKSALAERQAKEYFAEKKREEEKWKAPQEADEEARIQKLEEPPLAIDDIISRFREMGQPRVSDGSCEDQKGDEDEDEDEDGEKKERARFPELSPLCMFGFAAGSSDKKEDDDKSEESESEEDMPHADAGQGWTIPSNL